MVYGMIDVTRDMKYVDTTPNSNWKYKNSNAVSGCSISILIRIPVIVSFCDSQLVLTSIAISIRYNCYDAMLPKAADICCTIDTNECNEAINTS